jgi:hypothetical protein
LYRRLKNQKLWAVEHATCPVFSSWFISDIFFQYFIPVCMVFYDRINLVIKKHFWTCPVWDMMHTYEANINLSMTFCFCRPFFIDITALLEFITKMIQQSWHGSLWMSLDAHLILLERLFRFIYLPSSCCLFFISFLSLDGSNLNYLVVAYFNHSS